MISDEPDRVICRPVGDLDAWSVGTFYMVLNDVTRSGLALTIDLLLLTFTDLAGAKAILAASRYVSGQGGSTRVVGGSEAVRRMLRAAEDLTEIEMRSSRSHLDDPGPRAS